MTRTERFVSDRTAKLLPADGESSRVINSFAIQRESTTSYGDVDVEPDGTMTVTSAITALTGDVTASGSGSVVATISSLAIATGMIQAGAVTLAKIANASANDVLLGSGNSGSGSAYTQITLGSGLAMTGTVLSSTGGGSGIEQLTGDVTATGPGVVAATIAALAVETGMVEDDAITYAKIQNVSATLRILGRSTAGAGVIEELTATLGSIDFLAIDPARGDMLYSDANGSWEVLAGTGDAQRAMLNVTDATADRMVFFDSGTTAATTPLTSFARTVIDDTGEEALRETVGIGITRGTDFNPFLGSGASQMRKGSSTSGSGAAVAQGWEWVNTTNNWGPGAMKVETGITSTGRAAFHTGNNLLILGSGAYLLETLISTEALSTVSEEYILWWGIADNVTSATDPTRGAFFRYDRLGEGVNWMAVTRSGGVETATDTGIAVTAGFTQAGQKLKIVADADGGEVRFYIDDTLEATHTTNINTSSRQGTFGRMVKSAGTTEVGCGWAWERFSWSDVDDLD